MSFFRRLATLAVALSAVPATTHAMDDFVAASSRAPTAIVLCGDGGQNRIKVELCQQAGYDKLVTQIDKAFDIALAGMPANIKPLLKRDQAWFNEVLIEAANLIPEFDDPDVREGFAQALRQRVAVLQDVAGGSGRPGFTGRWVNAFGSVMVRPADGGYRLSVDMRANYGIGSDYLRQCRLDAVVKQAGSRWLTGQLLPEPAEPEKTGSDTETTAADAKPLKPPTIRIRRQGETLRLVLAEDEEGEGSGRADCNYMWQITGSYFAAGKPDTAARDKADTAFATPTFDCTRPDTASDEEICSDPDLADNDRRLNRAWKALLPRLDEVTRHALTEDQRNWVKSQTNQYPQFLHPAWNKTTSQMHSTEYGRERLERLQRERIALLEGFDDKRNGLGGTWLAYNAVIQVAVDKDGKVTAKGWKWEQGDWKAGCDYEISGRLTDGAFQSSDGRKNPDTLERDHATLIVNRLDEAFAKKRYGAAADGDEAKCKRRLDNSSTARLFPARPSPDIDNLGGSSIR